MNTQSLSQGTLANTQSLSQSTSITLSPSQHISNKKPLSQGTSNSRSLSQGQHSKIEKSLSQGALANTQSRFQGTPKNVKKPLFQGTRVNNQSPSRGTHTVEKSLFQSTSPTKSLFQGSRIRATKSLPQGTKSKTTQPQSSGEDAQTMAQGTPKRSGDTQTPPPAPPPTFPRRKGNEMRKTETTQRLTNETTFFTTRNGKELGKLIQQKLSWDEIPLYATAPSTFSKNQSLLRRFKTFAAENLPGECKLSEAICRFAWWSLGSANPKSVANYIGKLCKSLMQEGHKGVRTKQVLLFKRALIRLSTYIRPNRALPVKTGDIKGALRSLIAKGREDSAAMLATAWVTRCRIPDLRFLTSEDVREMGGGDDVTKVGLGIFAKDKGRMTWSPAVYMPPGPLTAIAVGFWRKQLRGVCVFGGEGRQYERVKREIREAMPGDAWLHSTKRGAAQEMDGALVGDEENTHAETMQQALRHKNASTTLFYLDELNPRKRQAQTKLLRPLQ